MTAPTSMLVLYERYLSIVKDTPQAGPMIRLPDDVFGRRCRRRCSL